MLQAAPIGTCLSRVFICENSRFSTKTVAELRKMLCVNFSGQFNSSNRLVYSPKPAPVARDFSSSKKILTAKAANHTKKFSAGADAGIKSCVCKPVGFPDGA